MTGFLLPDRYTVWIINALTFGKQAITLLLQRIHHDFTGNSGKPELDSIMRGKSGLPESDCVQMSYGVERQAGRRNTRTRNPFCILPSPERGGGCVRIVFTASGLGGGGCAARFG
jgi:hypothetical protein